MIGEAAALAAAVCWAVGSHLWSRVARRATLESPLAPGALNLGKCVAAGAMFAATGLVVNGRVVPSVAPRPMAWLVVSGVIGLTLGDSAYFGCMALLGVRRALLLLSTAPIFAAIGGAVFLGEPLGAPHALAILVAVAGVALVVNEGNGSERAPVAASAARVAPLGILYGLGAGLGQAAGSLASRAAMASGVDPLDTALVRLPAGIAGMVLLAGVSGRLVPWARSLTRPGLPGAILGAAFVGTYSGIWLAQLAIGRASSTAVASTLLATSPIFALPIARVLEGERISLRAVLGTLVACAGLAVLVFAKA
jgi:drug/metabolite transporter (DMT)-like permease